MVSLRGHLNTPGPEFILGVKRRLHFRVLGGLISRYENWQKLV